MGKRWALKVFDSSGGLLVSSTQNKDSFVEQNVSFW